MIGNIDKITRTLVIPNFSAKAPKKEITIAITPQQKPFINPATMLLYFGKVFCAQTKVTG